MDWKVAAGTPAMVFTITFPLTVPAERERGLRRGQAEGAVLPEAPLTHLPACWSL